MDFNFNDGRAARRPLLNELSECDARAGFDKPPAGIFQKEE